MDALVNGIRLHYELAGPVDGVPVLFVHGFPLTGEMWNPCLEHLREVRAIVPDVRGFGSSSLAPDLQPGVSPPLSIAQCADDLYLLLEHLGERRPVIVAGHSMGGYIALEFHRRYTSRVQGLALVDTKAQADTPEKIAERHATARKVLDEGSAVVANPMSEKLFGPDAPRELRERWRTIMNQQSLQSIAAALYAMAARGGYIDVLRTIFCPTLIIVGEHDSITPPDEAQLMHRHVLASVCRVVKGAGHMTPVEQPRDFAAALNEFVTANAVGAS